MPFIPISTPNVSPDAELQSDGFFLSLFSPQMVRRARSAGTASSTLRGTTVSATWRRSGCCRLPSSCETCPSRRPTSSCWRPTERACASFCSVPTVTSSHYDSSDSTRWATWLPRLVPGVIRIIKSFCFFWVEL